MKNRPRGFLGIAFIAAFSAAALADHRDGACDRSSRLDRKLKHALARAGFTGTIQRSGGEHPPPDLRPGPFEGILAAGIDPMLRRRIRLDDEELEDLVDFVENALFDERVLTFCELIPDRVPSGLPLQIFEGCE